MILERGSLLCSITQTSEQHGQALLKMHPVHQPILLTFKPVPLIRIVQAGLLKLIQQQLLFGPVLFKTLLLLFQGHKGSRGLTPELPCRSNLLCTLRQSRATETIKPTTLLIGTRQLLCLPLNGEIDQQRPQILQLLPVDGNTIQA